MNSTGMRLSPVLEAFDWYIGSGMFGLCASFAKILAIDCFFPVVSVKLGETNSLKSTVYFQVRPLMKKIVLFCVLLTGMLVTLSEAVAEPTDCPVPPYSSSVSPEELALMSAWRNFLLSKGESGKGEKADESRFALQVPFCFMCGDRSSREWIRPENAEIKRGEWKNGSRTNTLVWRDEKTQLVCEMQLVEYENFPAMSWTLFLKNEGTSDSAPIHDFKALDTSWQRKDGAMPILYRSQGSDGRTDDFVYVGEEMRRSMWTNSRTVRMDFKANSDFRRASNYSPFDSDTRPSATWLPFYNLRTGNDGVIVGIGWNGQWFAEIAHDGNGKCNLSAGMERLHTKLYPGESIRSPLILVFYWAGEHLHAQNLFRRFVLAHFTPQDDGKPIKMPACCPSWGGTPTREHLNMIGKIAEHKLPYDYYWIDAGWYGTSQTDCPNVFQGDWGTVGDWQVNRYRHPDTLKPISDAVKKANMKLLLWFEPIRATVGTPITKEHPEWFLKTSADAPVEGQSVLLNLGNPDARKWITDTISGLITENGIDCFREDFNIDPFPFWCFGEEPDRVGMTEMRFVEGVYSYWDELRRRHPGLMIDNCASGGRRIELETMKRSVPLWRTDYNCFPHLLTEATQAHTYGIAHWIPTNSISPFLTKEDTYQCRSGLSSGVIYGIEEFGQRDVDSPDYDWNWQRRRIEEAKQAMPYFYGDFYPLTTGNYSEESWLAYHFYLPEKEEGMIVAFRRPKADVVAMNVDLLTVDPDAKYLFEDVDTGEKTVMSGEEVRQHGYAIKTTQPRESKLIFYKKF